MVQINNFRFRIRRHAGCFSDKCSMDLFVQSDGTVRGTVRNITEAEVGFLPVEIKVDSRIVSDMKDLFDDVISSHSDSWINVGYGGFGSQLTVKRLRPPTEGQELSTNSRFWEMCSSLCDTCLQQYRSQEGDE